jgi:hypothetical protein
VLFYSSQHLVTYNRYFWQSRPLEIKSSIHWSAQPFQWW